MKKRAQSTIEYMVLIAVIAAALGATAIYTKRSLQGRIRAGADQISSESAYMPGGTDGTATVTRTIIEDSSTRVDKSGSKRDSITDAKVTINQNTTRNETAGAAPGGG